MPNAVQVVFNADTGQYVAGVDAATGAVTKQGQAVADAKNRILEALKQQTVAAKANGATTEELARIQTKAAESMANVTEKNATRVVAALDRISEKQKRVAQELQNLPTAPIGGESHGDDITNKQRASALLRGGGIRAGESFLTQFDAFNKISSAVFPVLGVAAIAKEGFAAAEAFRQMYETAEKLPSVLKDGFGDMNAPLELGVDHMRKANDELEILNAHLEHKSAGKPDAARQIDEIRISADEAASAARKAFLDVKKLLDENKSGYLQKQLFEKGETGGIAGDIESQLQHSADLERANRDAIRSGKDTPEAQAARDKEKADFEAYKRRYVADQRKIINGTVDVTSSDEGGNVSTAKVAYSDKYGDQTGNRNILNGYEDLLNNQEDTETESRRGVADQAQNKKLQDQAKMAEQAKAAKRAAEEAARKADEKRYNGFKTGEDVLKEYMPAEDVARDWDEFSKTFTAGSDKANEAVREAAASRQAADRAAAEAAKKAAEKAQKDQRNTWDADHDNWSTAKHRTAADEADYWSIRSLEATQGSENERMAWDKATRATIQAQKDAEEALKAGNKAKYEKGHQGTEFAEASLALDVQTGRISKQDAAYAAAAIHAEEYRQKVAELTDELKRQQDLDPNSAGTINAQAAIDKADADRKVQTMQDAAKEAAESWQGALKNANALWVQDAQDSGKQVAEIYGQELNGINDNVADAALRKKTNFGQTFQGLGKTVLGDGLKRVEAPLLSKLGLAKADGSKGNPLHVMVENLGSMGSAAGGFFSTAGKDAGDSASSFASFAKTALSFLPGGSLLNGLFGGHRALGGGVRAGVSYDVGEMGRETFTPATDGTITPNNRLGAGGASYAIYMDGGVTPEQVHQQVTAALKAVHPKVVRDATNAMTEKMARRPRSAG